MERTGEQKGRSNARQVHLRVPPEEFDLIKRNADRRGLSIYKYGKLALITFAKADNKDHDD